MTTIDVRKNRWIKTYEYRQDIEQTNELKNIYTWKKQMNEKTTDEQKKTEARNTCIEQKQINVHKKNERNKTKMNERNKWTETHRRIKKWENKWTKHW